MRLKKVKGALEKVQQCRYYVEQPEKYCGNWQAVFGNPNPIHVEIGMGKGRFITGMAKKYPSFNWIGIEMYDSVLVKAVQLLEQEEERNNIRLLLLDANQIDTIFKEEVDTIYLNFSDPWPKARHAKRRLTSPLFLKKYNQILCGNRLIVMKTDNTNLFQFSVEMLQENGYNLEEVTDDLAACHDVENVCTEYEEKFMEKGVKIHRLKARKQ